MLKHLSSTLDVFDDTFWTQILKSPGDQDAQNVGIMPAVCKRTTEVCREFCAHDPLDQSVERVCVLVSK